MSVSNGPRRGLMISALTGDSFDADFRKFLRAIDALLMAYVVNLTTSAPPGSPANGDAYIVKATGSGAWTGHDKAIAIWTTDNPAAPSGEWEFYAAARGMLVVNVADSTLYFFDGSAWSLVSDLSGAEKTVNKGAASGYCPLDSGSLVPVANLPALVVGHVYVVASQVAMLAVSANVGDLAVRTDINESFILQTAPASTLGNWIQILTPPGVTSVALGADSGGILVASGTPVTTTGTLQLQFANEPANEVLAGPTSGGSATPAFRSLVAADIPNIPESKVTGLGSDLGTLATAIASETTRAEAAEALAELLSNKNAANGYAGLDSNGNVPPSHGGVASEITAAVGGFWGGVTGEPAGAVATTGPQTASANRVYFKQFTLLCRVSVKKVSINVTASVASTHVSVGIYDAGGNLLVDSGQFDCSSNGVKTNTLGASVVLPPGVYYFAWSCDSTSSSLQVPYFTGLISQAALGAARDILNATAVRTGKGSNTVSSGAMPSALGTLSTASGEVDVQCAFFEPA